VNSKRVFLERRLFQISTLVWRIHWEEEGAKLVLEKSPELNIIENCKLQNEKCKFEGESLKCLSVSR
jgi:predicted RNA-binding protein with PUA domain